MRAIPNSDERDPFGEGADLSEAEIHSAKAHRCVDKVRGKGHGESSAWAICTASMGKDKVYAKGHGGRASAKRKVHEVDRVRESVVTEFEEKWSEAARKASAAARGARKKQQEHYKNAANPVYDVHMRNAERRKGDASNWRKAARKVFLDNNLPHAMSGEPMGGKDTRRRALQRADRGHTSFEMVPYSHTQDRRRRRSRFMLGGKS